MRAIVSAGARDLQVMEHPEPQPAADEVTVRVEFGGICGSDLHYHAHGANGAALIREPLTLGHEIAGVVESAGPGVAGDLVGRRVVVHPATPCPPAGCVDGKGFNRLPSGRYLGSAAHFPHAQGAFADRIAVRVDQLRFVDDSVPARRAALAEPLAVALHAVRQAGGDFRGREVLISGAGPIGCLAVAGARRAGARSITVSDLHQAPLDVARSVGADAALLLGSDQVPAAAFDVVIEASGAPAALNAAIKAVRDGGMVVQLGILPPGPNPIDLGQLITREVTLRGSQRFDVELDAAVELLAAAPELDGIVTHVFAPEKAAEAFEAAADSSRSCKVLLDFSA
ncbi:zinc-binding dehydrogenase (plasmid) [Arthrobacter sp. UC242_113]|uniref:zinc-binding dehydrogenase n=1 Tax=Arthrobacter sp. UC242_113 TaxID=3374550 RepID=UPI003757ADA8